ncbi:autotransporter-associated beta strand repeat-containing protein [uncultured Muribaculum sp.]|uniref:rhamnogalacturonan lyase family protein n=1 Tax=uncultured Muribaculum sp. TaxID=1918613 RepID=UPI002675ACFB|nr:autotransporter-associated beta strand repeat-containing protein [uncultured Muribaculum sp.]
MKKILFLAAATLLLAGQCLAQRAMDKLDRGLVAVSANNGVLVSWRVFGEDADNVRFNLYRDGALLNSAPLSVSNYTDASGSVSSRYVVKTVIDGVEKETSKPSIAMPGGYLEIKIADVPSNKDGSNISSHYEPNDATVADLDGDGAMEILIKLRNNTDAANSYSINNTDYDIIQVYKLDGTLLWWIDCGPNMVDFQSNEINIAAYDWDLDGKAECVLRGGDGMVIHQADGTKYVVGDPTQNTRNQLGFGGGGHFTRVGAEYLLYLNGETGKPYSVSEYPLKRFEDGETDLEKAWGDGYGHRSNKHFFGAPYLDGRKPSIFLARGIYTRHKMIAYDVDPATHRLVERWRWINNQPGSPWYGQGYHNYSIADVDWDGRDEIVFGSMVIDDNGRGLSTCGLGHGDSHHVGDFNPYVYGQEIVACNEDKPSNNYRDATTSKIYYRVTGSTDDGRAIAGNFSNDYPGAQFITSHDSGSLISTVTNGHIDGASPTNDVAQNFRIYWDGDLLDETFNGQAVRNSAGVIYKFKHGAIQTFTGTLTNNDTKATPCFQGDILGDWREEIILRAADNKSIRIYSTSIPTSYRLYTLLHDPQYRNAMVWQMNGYNQTPHPSFFLGELEGITQAPPSPTMTGREEVTGSIGTSHNGKSLVFAATSDATATVTDGASPALFVDNAPTWVQGHDDNDNISYEWYTHTLVGGGFAGNMKLVKLGQGTLLLPTVQQKYTGDTEIWGGMITFDGDMPNSHVWMNRFTALSSNGGKFGKGIEMTYGSELRIGNVNEAGSVTTTDLVLGFGSRICLDLFANGIKADQINATTLTIEKKTWENGPEYNAPIIVFKPHPLAGASKLAAGSYLLGSIGNVVGNLGDIVIEGLNGQKAALALNDGKLYLNVTDSREATEIVWTGANGPTWDVENSENFKISATGETTAFVSGDKVIFDDTAVGTTINLPETIFPSEIVFNNNSKNFTITGSGFGGNCNIEKKGTGRVSLKNNSTFTGSIQINNGVLEAVQLGANEGTSTGALGQYTNEITLNNGGTLAVTQTGKMSHPIVANNGGIEVGASATVTMTGASVTGNGTLIKSGSGQLNFMLANNVQTLRIDEGRVYDEGDKHKVASTVVFNGNKVELLHKNDIYSYCSDLTNFEVPEGKSGKLSMDGRCEYKGSLTGKGSLEVVSTNVRNFITGNWSEFEGTLTASRTDGSFDFYNDKDLAKATLSITIGCIFKNTESQNNRVKNTNMSIGALTGNGSLGGRGTYTIGGLNTDTSFGGQFAKDINIVKEGTGTLTLSKTQADMGTLALNAGTIMLRSTSESQKESMTGKSDMTVKGTLAGSGYCANPTVTFEAGSALCPTSTIKRNTFRSINFTGNLVMNTGSELVFEIIDNTKYGRINVDGNMALNGTVKVTLAEDYKPVIGDEFTLWTAGNATSVPTLILPELPEGLGWDTSAITSTNGVLKVGEFSGINDIAADELVNCKVVTTDGTIIREFTSKASDVINECNGLQYGTYILVLTGSDFSLTHKVVLK